MKNNKKYVMEIGYKLAGSDCVHDFKSYSDWINPDNRDCYDFVLTTLEAFYHHVNGLYFTMVSLKVYAK